eukprot:gnl/MRDRNA2_/MRDRNA2_202854_c0_seq1.p1 gnl/MRDRNA2_/MRDRNA2_202854_c0~~gnl/MRDRNA2_/MRDRNA2_202854_c0_seq1.p1  ORF type:complete len:415 (-),score=86.46 gnl/MRDRNA2_/MRDRNA2_202854_c0_seq1:472-1578(-)
MEPPEKKRKAGDVSDVELPLVDFSPFLRDEGVTIGKEPTPEQVNCAHQINEASRHNGFLVLRNAGIDKALVAEMFGNAKSLFALPPEDKAKLKKLDPATNTGFSALGTEALNRRRRADMKEAFNFREADAANFQNAPEKFENVTRQFWAQVKDSVIRYAFCCALALGLPPDYFRSKLQKFDLCTVRMNYYPALARVQKAEGAGSEMDLSSAVRVGEHTDFGAFTYLFVNDFHQAESQGLQVKGIAGAEMSVDRDDDLFRSNWRNVVFNEGLLKEIEHDDSATIIVNTGALMARWTNDTWPATAHRVVVTEDSAKADRTSIACFIDPDKSVICSVHDKFIPEGEEAKYPPISSLDYLLMKVREAQGVKA